MAMVLSAAGLAMAAQNTYVFTVAPIVPLGVQPGMKTYEQVLLVNNKSITPVHNVQLTDFLPKGVKVLSSHPMYKMVQGHPTWVVKSAPLHKNIIVKMTVQYPDTLSGKSICHRAKGHLLGTNITYVSQKFCSQVSQAGG
jgi:hypothetical protein